MSAECTADLGHPCDAGGLDENGAPIPCASCAASEAEGMREARREWEVMSPAERDPARYEREMRDAGRGHLLASPRVPRYPALPLPSRVLERKAVT